jgi:flagellar hook-length control protein FliK
MSVNSLPIIFANPVPTPDPGSSPPALPATSPGDGRGSFGAHLQHARNQPTNAAPRAHGAAQPSNPRGANASSGNPPANGNTSTNTNTNASSLATQASSSAASDISSQASSSQASDDSAGSLASAVLGLIGQSTADSGADTGATTDADGKSTADKPAVPVAVASDAPAPTPAPVLVVAIVPVPLPLPAMPVAPPAAASARTDSTATAVQGAAAAIRAGTTGAALPVDKFSAMALTQGGASASGDDASDDTGSLADVSLLAQSAGNTTAATAGTLPAPSDAVAAAVLDQSMATGAQPQDAAELAALRGVVGIAAPAPTTGTATGPALTVNSPVGSAGFAQELGQQVAWLGGQDIKQAQIRLNPQDLGPLDVKVSVEHGRVDVVFTAQHPEAVTAVQQSLGQLNQMLGGQGLSLGQAMVSQQQTAQQQFGAGSGQSGRGRSEAGDDEPLEALSSLAAQPVALGLLDTFA